MSDLLALQDYYFYAVVNNLKINYLRMKVMYTVTAMLWYQSLDKIIIMMMLQILIKKKQTYIISMKIGCKIL